MDKGKEHFDGIENDYENLIRCIVPCYSDFYDSVLSYIPDRDNLRILELGSGTGFFTSMMMQKNSGIDITCIDLSKGMLDVARKKPNLSNVNFIEGDFRNAWGEGLYDVVVTTLCMHHIPGTDKSTLVEKIYGSLNNDGVLLNGDVFFGKNSFEETLNMQWWYSAMIKAGLDKEEANAMIAKRKDNSPYIETIHNFAGTLNTAGFKNVVLPYKNRIYGVFAAFK